MSASLRNAFVVFSILFSLNTGSAAVRTIRTPRLRSGRVRVSALPAFSAARAAADQKEKEETPSPVFALPATARKNQSALGNAVAKPAASFNGLGSPLPSVTFQAQPMVGNFPPDTTGAAGPNHVVSASNDEVVVQDRAGHTLQSTTPNNFWEAAFPDMWDPLESTCRHASLSIL